MRRDAVEIDRRGRVEMRGLVDSDETDSLNAVEQSLLGRGLTMGRTMRKVANIDAEELMALCLKGDRDALEFAASGHSSRKALRNLLHRFPAWRCSEGAV